VNIQAKNIAKDTVSYRATTDWSSKQQINTNTHLKFCLRLHNLFFCEEDMSET